MIHTCALDSTDRPRPEQEEGGKGRGEGSWENRVTGGAVWPETQRSKLAVCSGAECHTEGHAGENGNLALRGPPEVLTEQVVQS